MNLHCFSACQLANLYHCILWLLIVHLISPFIAIQPTKQVQESDNDDIERCNYYLNISSLKNKEVGWAISFLNKFSAMQRSYHRNFNWINTKGVTTSSSLGWVERFFVYVVVNYGQEWAKIGRLPPTYNDSLVICEREQGWF